MGDVLHYTVVGAYGAATRLLFELHVDGARRYRQQRGTVIVLNHKRDSDSVIVPPLLIFNGTRPIRPMWFAGREDMFVTGFLALRPPVPDLLRPALARTNLSRVLRALHILPVRRFPERTMHEALEEFRRDVGDRPLADVLAAPDVEALAAAGPPNGLISDALAWRHRRWWSRRASVRAFLPAWQGPLAARQREVVDAQLRALAAVLDRGDSLYLAPEGVLSSDGRLQVFRAGLRRVLALVQSSVRYLPVAIVYDFMGLGRIRAFISIGEEMPASGAPDEVERNSRRAVAALHTMTCTQIGSRVLWNLVRHGEDTITVHRFAASVLAQAAELRDSGLRIDPDLAGPGGRRRVHAYVGYLKRRGVALVNNGEMLVDAPYLRRVEATDRQNPVRYAVNELESVLDALGRPETGSRKPITEEPKSP